MSWYNADPVITLVICLITCVAMGRRLQQVKDSLSDKTRSMYSGFIKLLVVDTGVVFIYFIATQMDFVSQLSKMSDEMKDFCNFFSHPFFAVPRMVQGLALLFLVPYLRGALFNKFKRKMHNSVAVISSANPSSISINE